MTTFEHSEHVLGGSKEKVAKLAETGVLYPLYCMPLRFNGEESDRNRLFVPKAIVELKDRYDDMVEELLVQGKVNGYSCTPQHKGKSFVPSDITVVAKKDGEAVVNLEVVLLLNGLLYIMIENKCP